MKFWRKKSHSGQHLHQPEDKYFLNQIKSEYRFAKMWSKSIKNTNKIHEFIRLKYIIKCCFEIRYIYIYIYIYIYMF